MQEMQSEVEPDGACGGEKRANDAQVERVYVRCGRMRRLREHRKTHEATLLLDR